MAKTKQNLTIHDIAELSGFSAITVSRVVNDFPHVRAETRQKIRDVIKHHGYVPDLRAVAFASRRSFLVAMIYDNPSSQYLESMQRGILNGLEDTQYQLVPRPVDRNDPKLYETLQKFIEQHKPYGVILLPSVSEDDAIVALLQELNCPYVRIAGDILDMSSRMVVTRDFEGGALAARHIAERGHTLIGHIHGPNSFISSHQRLLGFKKGLMDFGLILNERYVLEAGYTYESGRQAGLKLLSHPYKPTAIFAGNDEMAIGVYQAARELRLNVPEDISVVSYDDTPMVARLNPALTAVRLPIRHVGQRAAELLMGIVNTPQEQGGLVFFTPELIVRDSVFSLKTTQKCALRPSKTSR